ncbi:MAG: glycosyl hydrolase [Lentisphaeraceae bacterium]|nr:glycosyl hydrolase [Lentisphaeraceae bacterium]
MKAVPVGKGSYASEPPLNKGTSKLYSIKPFIEKESQGKPLPTNDWWTSLLSESPFPGKMWAYPLTISADSNGPLIWYCKEWNDNGTEMRLGEPLRISAVDSGPKDPNADITLFDFEHNGWGKWQAEGNAFGPGPMTEKKHKLFKYAGTQYACSFDKGDPGIGKLLSPEFTINRDFMKFLIAGGNDKNKLGVFLIIDGKRVLQEVGKNGVECHWKTWDLKKFKGKKARIEISDQSKGGWGFIAADHFILSNKKEMASSGIFSHASTKNWGDWTVSMRLNAGKEKHFDVTFGRGLPYTWIESKGLGFEIASKVAKYYTLEGTEAKLPLTGDALIVEIDKRLYGLFAPDKSTFVIKNKKLQVQTKGGKSFLSIAAIPDLSKAIELHKYAFAVPRNSKFDWSYNQKDGAVSTTWTAETEALKGSNKELLQGWIPHHWRITKHNLKFSNLNYRTQRGLLKLVPGNEFKISWPFQGMMPTFPLPNKNSSYDEKVLTGYLDKWISEKEGKPKHQQYRADTYWGGKDFLKLSQVMTIAGQMKHPKYEATYKMTKGALTDWLTYTPGEKEHFFAKYKAPWNGIVGFKPSFGSETFTDNHFHYGYTILASALLGLQDKEWVSDYKDMLTLIAKQYANWDRDNKDFPFLRTFDPWGGHSYAGGMSSNHDGNNQESSSEAMGSWAGLFLLGDVLGNDKMRACGAMGYAIEAEAIHEYWNDYYGWNEGQEASNYSEKYEHTIVSVLRDRDIGYWTWFSGEPKHIYGIQWLPVWTTMHYLAKDAEFVDFQVENMLKKQGKGKPYNISKIDRDWGHVTLGYKLWGNTQEACKIIDTERKSNRPIGDYQNGGLSYFLAHSYKSLGRVAPEYHTSLPTSLAFKDGDKIKVTLMNHSPGPKEVIIYKDGKEIEKVTAPGKTLHTYQLK